MAKKIIQKQESFFSYLLLKQNLREIGIWLLLAALVWGVMHFFYPYFFYFSDTWTYLQTAVSGVFSCYRPAGYVWFIDFCHKLHPSYLSLIIIQYLLHIIASLFIGYTVKYLLLKKSGQVNTVIFRCLMGFLLFSPALLFMTKYVMSEGFFVPLLLFWGGGMIWFLHKKKWLGLLIIVIILYFLVRTRYIGMVFAVLSIGMVLLCFERKKVISYISIILFVGVCLFANTESKKSLKETYGIYDSDGFGGWSRMNGLLCLMPEMRNYPLEDFENPKYQDIHAVITSFPDSVFNEHHLLATSYIWDSELPLKTYLFQYMEINKMNYPKAWIKVGNLYGEYSLFLIKKHPWDYFKKWIIWNSGYCFHTFNIDENDSFIFNEQAEQLYGLKADTDYVYPYKFFRSIYPIRKISDVILWLLVLASIFFWLWKYKSFSKFENRVLLFLILWGFCYAGGSVIGSSVNNFRYLLPLFAPRIIFVSLMFSFAIRYKQCKKIS